MLEKKLYEYLEDVENPELNYKLAIEYKNIGQTASALSFFLRCADRSGDDLDLAYECLIHIAECFDRQGNRTTHAYGAYKQAISILPRRPEAYYQISRLKNWNSLFDDGYNYSSIALKVCDFKNLKPLRDVTNYTGIHCLLFEKALSSWHWGKLDECKNGFLNLYENHWNEMSQYQKNISEKYLKEYYDISIANLETRKTIPVIGVPIVNGVQWLKRLVDSVDYPVENFFIVNNNGRNEITEEINEICNTQHPFIRKFHVSHMPSNFGCGGGWNLIIKSYMMEPYWILASHDIQFSPGMLKSMHEEAIGTDHGMIYAKRSDWGGGSYDVFLIKDWVVQKCGLFDENLYPAYAEDIDYHIRLINENISYRYLDLEYLHGEKDYSTSGSQTWRVDTTLKDKIDQGRILNETRYMTKKWGNDYQSLNAYSKPFNTEIYDSGHMTYDLEFIRKKYLGF